VRAYDLNERILIDRQTVEIREGFPISTPYMQVLRINGGIVHLRILHKSAPRSKPRQHPTTQFFTGWMPLPPNQQRQSTEGRMEPRQGIGNLMKFGL